MSMFNRFLTSIGIGAAKVDTMLERGRYAPGEEVRGVVKIRGGQGAQHMEGIRILLMTQYTREADCIRQCIHCELQRYDISEAFTIDANETRDVPFSIVLPPQTPLSIDNTPVWLKTELDMTSALDPTDNDRIELIPSVEQSIVIDAVNRLGFRLRKAECEYAPRLGGRYPFVQEFEFVPTSYFRGDLDELEMVFLGTEQQLGLLIQIDRSARSAAGWLNEVAATDESFTTFRLTNTEWRMLGAEGFAGELAERIRRML
ncbi:sporulation protein [Paenibacillus profundus]|uniref:Sporulation protein n=1 Tax=Paenibacillus profundus TaxID=1173085 RepID=A0ABS8YC71_9BACL|nr:MULTISPECIES: sporulation protein [Paenibacillus]MCE5168582.1 sporulation protein [Paenibacillus profundus]